MNSIGHALTIIGSGAPRCGTVRVQVEGSGYAPALRAGGVFGEARPVLLHRQLS